MNELPLDQIIDHIYNNFDFFSAPMPLKISLLSFAGQIVPQLPDLVLTEKLLDQRLLQEYVSALLKKQQDVHKSGLFCPYEILLDNDEIVGFSYPRPTDSPIMQRVRQVASQIPIALNTIRELTPREFELFCSEVLNLLNAEESMPSRILCKGKVVKELL